MNIAYILKYLDTEKIKLDKKEFTFQVHSNPNHSSLIAIVDALDFFAVESTAFKLDFSEIHKLPEHFVALLLEANGQQTPFMIVKENNHFVVHDETKRVVTSENLEKLWTGIVLLVRKKQETETIEKPNKINYYPILFITMAFLFLVIVIYNDITLIYSTFILLPIVGLLLSVFYLKDLFTLKNSFIAKICESGETTSCEETTQKKRFLQISDLGMVYFSFQVISLFVFLALEKTDELFTLFKILSIAAIPAILLSLYYQKFIRKKWCPLCLGICLVLLFQCIYLYTTVDGFSIGTNSAILTTFILILTIAVWKLLRNALHHKTTSQQILIDSNRIVRNYEVFKNTLLTYRKLSTTAAAFTNTTQTAKAKITAIISPLCAPCEATFENLQQLYQQHKNELELQIILKTNFELNDDLTNTFFRNLGTIYLKYGFEKFMKCLEEWYNTKNMEQWNALNTMKYDKLKVDRIYKEQNDWCMLQGISFTPALFVNNYALPGMYDASNLKYFINDLKEDASFKLA